MAIRSFARSLAAALVLGAGLAVVPAIEAVAVPADRGGGPGETSVQAAPIVGPFVVAPSAAAGTTFDVLQMNLCNSGKAGCYTGGAAVGEALRHIEYRRPTVVTLNEVCRNDLTRLAAETGYRQDFTAAGRRGGGTTTCTNGQDYGIGMLVRPDQGGPWAAPLRRVYSAQDSSSSELRVFACLRFPSFTVCQTHLAGTPSVAVRQCAELRSNLQWFADRETTVAAGDFNLSYGGSYSVQQCVPTGMVRKSDGDVQQAMYTSRSFGLQWVHVYSMVFTDHDALALRLTKY